MLIRSRTCVAGARVLRSRVATAVAGELPFPAVRGGATNGSRSTAIRRTGGGIIGSIGSLPARSFLGPGKTHQQPGAGPALAWLSAPVREPGDDPVQEQDDDEQHEGCGVCLLRGAAFTSGRVFIDVAGEC